MQQRSAITSPTRVPPLASLACRPADSRGRQHPFGRDDGRSGFQRDHDRIIHARAFRKLQHKTQVFVASELDAHRGDFFRTRLTHSLEVGQIARTICRQLGLDEDLGAAISLAHDLGHTPFGHTGEDALSAALEAAGFAPFDHNDQTLRTLTVVESSYPQHPGLNLTWETLEGIAKHNGPIFGSPPPAIADLDAVFPLELERCASLEAQVAAVCDDIAYNSHDIDDGLRADLFTLDELCQAVPICGDWVYQLQLDHPQATLKQCGFEVIRQVISHMVHDILAVGAGGIAPDFRDQLDPVVQQTQNVEVWLQPLRDFLFTRMYRHPSVMETRDRVSDIVRDLYGHYSANPRDLPDDGPEDWFGRWSRDGDPLARNRVIVDYIAGMTDRYALARHAKIFEGA